MTKNAKTRENYHHGDLPKTLIKEGAKLIAENGIEKFSLREVARRAGVAVAAPAHHFGNINGLFTAIAAEGFQKLGDLAQATENSTDDLTEHVILICKAYTVLNESNPGHIEIMVRLNLLDDTNLDLQSSAFRAFGYLMQAVRKALPDDTDHADVNRATRTLWAMMQGIVGLKEIDDLNPDEVVEFAVTNLLRGIENK